MHGNPGPSPVDTCRGEQPEQGKITGEPEGLGRAADHSSTQRCLGILGAAGWGGVIAEKVGQ